MTQEPKLIKPIRLIATDVDHTLLNKQHELTPRVEKALRGAMAKGVQIILATGKTFQANIPLIQKLGLTAPGIYAQGTIAFNPDGTIRHQQVMNPAVARQIITFAEDRGFSIVAYSGNRLLLRQHHPFFERMMSEYHEPVSEIIGPLQNVMDSLPINKMVVFSFTEDGARAIKALRWQLSMQVNGSVRLLQAGVSQMLEIMPPGAGKGPMLKTLLKDLDITPDEVMAIGDAENDIEMLQLAAVGVAVGNAGQHVKDTADYVAPSYEEDGVADAIERFVLQTDTAEQPEAETITG